MTKRLPLVGVLSLGLAFLFALGFFVATDTEPAVIQTPERFAGYQVAECWFQMPDALQIQCGHLYTGHSRGGFVLPVVVIRDSSAERRPDPLVYLTGGPGSSSFLEPRNIDHWFYWLETANLSRDLVLVDQRGTGLSEPSFRCHGYEAGLRRVLDRNLSLREEQEAVFGVVEECLALMPTEWSLEQFSTSHSAADMSAVMEALGYERWNVMGTSYGTRLALEWLRQDGERIRALILDSVYPLEKGSLVEWPPLLHRSFETFWNHCRYQGWCAGDEQAAFWRALEQLRIEPRALTVPLHGGGWPVRVVLNEHRFMGALYAALYDDTLHQHIPKAINEVLNAGEESLKKLVSSTVNSQLAMEFNPMVYLAVDCAESAAPSREEYESVRANYPGWSAFTQHAWDHDLCRLVPRRADLAEFKQAVQSTVPTLILSGGLDPVTPDSWARDLTTVMPNAQQWHMPDVGHGVAASRACIHQSLGGFLDAPEQRHPLPCR